MFAMRLSLPAQTVPTSFEQAQQALNKGDYAQAEAQFRALLAKTPNSPEVLEGLGIALQMQAKPAEAMTTFERALKLKRLPGAISMLALDFCRNHQFDRAAPLLKEAQAFLDDPNVMDTLGPCYLEAGQPDIAVGIYEKLVALGSPPADENAVNLVRAYLDLSQKLINSLISLPDGIIYAKAIEASRKDGSLDAKSLFQQAYQAAPYLNPGMSTRELVALLSSHPSDPPLLYILGVQCAEKAAEAFDGAQEKWPGSIAVSQMIAELKDSSGDRDGAIQVYEQILATHPDAPASTHFALGLLYSERQRWGDALSQYDLASSDAKGSLYITQRISEALLHLGRDQAVMALLRGVVSDAHAPFWALEDFGVAAERLKQDQTALKYLKRASDLEPKDASLHYRLGDIYRKLHQPKAAADELATFERLKTTAQAPSNTP
jgi:tetratricopeptide (TPR) repeat protein